MAGLAAGFAVDAIVLAKLQALKCTSTWEQLLDNNGAPSQALATSETVSLLSAMGRLVVSVVFGAVAAYHVPPHLRCALHIRFQRYSLATTSVLLMTVTKASLES